LAVFSADGAGRRPHIIAGIIAISILAPLIVRPPLDAA